MDPATIMAGVELGVKVLTILVQLINAHDNGEAPQVGDKVAEFIGNLSTVDKNVKIDPQAIAKIAPAANELFSQIHNLIQKAKARHDAPAAT